VIPAFNEQEYITECLNSIIKNSLNQDRYEIIVVDNGSTDNTVKLVNSFKQVKLFSYPDVNVGAVRNFGAKISKYPFLIFIDADCLLPEIWLEKAENIIGKNQIDAFGGGCKLRDNPCWVEKYWLLEKNGEATLPKHLIGASILIPKATFNFVGKFNEEITSGEDTALSQKLTSNGFHVHLISILSVIHLGNARNLTAFLQRQVWHASNYLENPQNSVKDPIFILISVFIFFIGIGLANFFFTGEINPTYFVVALLIPAILSIKRIKRSKIKLMKNINNLPKIYIIDLFYILGRSTGLIKSLIKKVT
jgi:glycosyltransferase involved in cell wall biosynthesis